MEAQATGMPTVSTFHADTPEVVVPGESALLSPERDVDGLHAVGGIRGVPRPKGARHSAVTLTVLVHHSVGLLTEASIRPFSAAPRTSPKPLTAKANLL